MSEIFSRTELLLGSEAMKKLAASRVAVFGAGGVGGFAIEALARVGIGAIDIIDNDTVSESNINRQIFALTDTVGRYKTEVAAQRIAKINPDAAVGTYNLFYSPDTQDEIDLSKYDYVIDAIDTVAGKLALAVNATRAGVPLISSMGMGNKLDPTALEVTDIFKTSVCPLAKVMRTELKKRGIKKLKVVYSRELPMKPLSVIAENGRRQLPGSISFVPSAAGLMLAGEVIKDLIGMRGNGLGA